MSNCMKKMLIAVFAVGAASSGWALVDWSNSVQWYGDGDWMNTNNWEETAGLGADWGIPGWVVGNPLNTDSSTSETWNQGEAMLQSGTVNLTDSSKPDGVIKGIFLGFDLGSPTLNISTDFEMATFRSGYIGSGVYTVNHTSGNVTNSGYNAFNYGGDGSTVYNLSGGSLTFTASSTWHHFGRYANSSLTFNQTGGTFEDTDSTTAGNVVADQAGSTADFNISGGSFTLNKHVRAGVNGAAAFNLSGAGELTSTAGIFYLGYYAAGSASLAVSDSASVNIADELEVGRDGTGSVEVTGGTLNANGFLNLANSAGSTGVITLTNGTLNAGGNDVYVGRNGTGTINQSGGTFNVAGTVSVGRYNDAVGTLNLSGGTLDINGYGMFVGYSADGVVNQTGGDLSVNVMRLADNGSTNNTATGLYSISGGSLIVSSYLKGGAGGGAGVFEVSGSGASSIEVGAAYFYGDTFRVKLDGNGSTLFVDTSADTNGINLASAQVEVGTLDGFNGTIGDTYDLMWTADGFNTSNMVISNLNSSVFDWQIVSKDGGEVLQVKLLGETAGEVWAGTHGLIGADAASDADPDEDGYDNLAEFAFGGDPSDGADIGFAPALSFGADTVDCVYGQRTAADSGISYTVEETTDLVYGTWGSNYTFLGSGLVDEFEVITNRASTAGVPERFFRVTVEEL